ncbi:MAG: hypothetical protein E7666_02125 [Ruminococcaceae bacterium]|nr:hypothetical protein [Oscillospiraceae bacterium]
MGDRILFVASTPYQLLNCLNIRKQILNEETVADIAILDISDKCRYLTEIAINSKMFDTVGVIDVGFLNGKRRVLYYLNRLHRILFIKKYLHAFKTSYDEIYIVGTEAFSKAIYYHYYHKNKKIKLKYYEDGTGSYDFILVENQNKMRNRIFKILFGFDLIEKCQEMLVYEPSLVESNYPYITIKPIPKINRDSVFFHDLKEIFSKSTPMEKIPKVARCVFLDSNWAEQDISICQEQVIKHLIEKFGDNVQIKLHPSSAPMKYGKNVNYLKTDLSMEILSMFYDAKKTVLISVYSTANIVNALVYGDAVCSVFLFEMFNVDKDFTKNSAFLRKFMKKTNGAFFIPKNIDELIKIIEEKTNG